MAETQPQEERRRLAGAEAELRRAHAFLEGITLGTEDLIAAQDLEGRYTFFNGAYRREFARLWGGHELQLGDVMWDLMSAWPEERDRAAALWARAAAGESFRVTEAFGPTSEEAQVYDLRFNPVRDADGAIIGAAHILRNVTEEMKTQARLARGERAAQELAGELATERMKLAAVIDNLPVGVGTSNAEGRVLTMNRRGLALHGWSSEAEMLGSLERYAEEFDLHDMAGRRLPLEEWPAGYAVGGHFVRNYEVRLSSERHGVDRILLYDVVPVRDADGEVLLIIYVMQDLTERKRAEEALHAAKAAAEQASQAKSQFLATMSHELRTPLSGVIGYADLLESEVMGPTTARQKETLARIKGSSWHLVAIIDEVLSLSRAEAGREEVNLQPTDVAAIVRDVVEIVGPQARSAGLVLNTLGAAEPLVLTTDPGKVRQILVNLVGNAAKYTPEGEVQVRLVRPEGGGARIHVQDTGPGIPERDLERVFEPFTQVDSSYKREKSGTGLGLAIARRMARLLGGDVHLESREGEGSTFTLVVAGSGELSEGAEG